METAPQAGKLRLRFSVLRTRRATIKARAACRWPAPQFSWVMTACSASFPPGPNDSARSATAIIAPAAEVTRPADHRQRRAGGVVSTRPLSGVTRDSAKSASQVSQSTAGLSTAISAAANPAAEQSAHRRSANPQPPSLSSGPHRRSGFSTPRKGARRNPAGAALSTLTALASRDREPVIRSCWEPLRRSDTAALA